MSGSVRLFRRNGMGDVILAEPVIRALRKEGYDHVGFDASAWQEVFNGHPDIENFTGGKMFDLTDAYERRMDNLIVDSYLEHCNLSKDILTAEEKIPRLYLTDEEKKWAQEQLNGDCIAFDIRRGEKYRGFWPIEEWFPALDFLKSNGFKIAAIGDAGKHDGEKIDLDFRGKTTLRQYMALIGECKYYFGIAAGSMVIKYALGGKGVAIFNPDHPAKNIMPTHDKIFEVHRAKTDALNINEIILCLETLVA